MWSAGWPSPRSGRTSRRSRRPRGGGRRAGWCWAAPWSCSAWSCSWTGSPPTWLSCSGRPRWSRSCWAASGDDDRADPAGPAGPAGRPARAGGGDGAGGGAAGPGRDRLAAGRERGRGAVAGGAARGLIAVGLACVAGAFRGRQHALMVVGVALTVVLALAAAAGWDLDVPLGGGVGDRTERPGTPGRPDRVRAGDRQPGRRPAPAAGPAGDHHRRGPGRDRRADRRGPPGVSVAVVASSGLGQVQALGEVVGVLFVLAGVLFLLDALEVWRLRVDYLVPLALIVLGLVVLASAWPLRSR